MEKLEQVQLFARCTLNFIAAIVLCAGTSFATKHFPLGLALIATSAYIMIFTGLASAMFKEIAIALWHKASQPSNEPPSGFKPTWL